MLTGVSIGMFLGRSRRGAAARALPAARGAPGAATVARTWTRAGRGWALALVVVLATAGVEAVGSGRALAASGRSAASAPAPVSNAFAMGGGVGGSVDQRTGTFSASFPLVTLNGRSGVGASLSLGYDQSLASQGEAGNRFGLGAGWSIGLPWVDTAGGIHVFPAAGGSYAYDADSPTGLSQYPLKDLTFAQASGVVASRRVASPGSCQPTARLAGAQSYAWTLTYRDGAVDRFDASGNLIERADRFGNRVDITWQQAGSHWQPPSVVDNYGQATCFDYGAVGGVKITSPPALSMAARAARTRASARSKS